MALIQQGINPLFLTKRNFMSLADAEAAYNDLVDKLNLVLVRTLDNNVNQLQIWGDRRNELTKMLMLGGM